MQYVIVEVRKNHMETISRRLYLIENDDVLPHLMNFKHVLYHVQNPAFTLFWGHLSTFAKIPSNKPISLNPEDIGSFDFSQLSKPSPKFKFLSDIKEQEKWISLYDSSIGITYSALITIVNDDLQ